MNFQLFIIKKLKINHMSKNFNPIIIVGGEPKSIFLEIYLKIFRRFKNNPLILIANKKLLNDQMSLLKKHKPIRILDHNKNLIYYKLNNKKINLIDIPLYYKTLKNIKNNNSNDYIKKSFDIAIKLLNKNKKFNLVNGPIIKKSFLKKKHLGITEYLGAKYNKSKEVVMLIYNEKIAVSPLTTHIPLKKVHKLISKKKIINHVMKIDKFYKRRLNKRPSIGLTGLNPHCESNFNSSEEDRILKPAINFLIKKNYKISGYPADTIFMKNNTKKFDVIIGMYHEQVLAPIKALYEFDAINITLGLPFIRVSPDHGPNLKMFGKNMSNTKSLMRAIKFLSKR